MTQFTVVTSAGGTIATEIKDANPKDETAIYDLNGTTWELQ